jgi:glutamate--cysteine ligase
LTRRIDNRLRKLTAAPGPPALRGGLRGLERETLRVTPRGYIAATDHPARLGSALTNRYITTDYSEALLEFITPALRTNAAVLENLGDIHDFACRALDGELLWALSMPCTVRSEDDIPIARYGHSNVGRMKTIYRRGLGLRYGRYMQAIAGVHFNFSLPEEFWPAYAAIQDPPHTAADLKSEAYLGLVRNVRRMDWLLLYLFGASPAVCKCFLPEGDAGLQEFDRGTYYAPHATSLRMSDIGYKNSSQAELTVSANSLDEYIRDLTRAIRTPEPVWAELGVVVNGDYQQLNGNQLQIENEYYSTIRPKRTALSGERPTMALRRGGVEYVELRALDVSPYDPAGIGLAQMDFCEAFLIYCLLADSPPIARAEQQTIGHNLTVVARRGREPGLALRRGDSAVPLADWAGEILDDVLSIAVELDAGGAGTASQDAVRDAIALIREPEATPSARMLRELRDRGQGLADYGLEISQRFMSEALARPVGENRRGEELRRESDESLERQRWIEEHDRVSFEEYLAAYYV